MDDNTNQSLQATPISDKAMQKAQKDDNASRNLTKIGANDKNVELTPKELRYQAIIKKLPTYSAREEKINVITHFIGALIGIGSTIAMIVLTALNFSAVNLIGSLIFGASLIYLYVNSTLYHRETDLHKRVVRQKLDHSSINVLISGSNTFFMLAGLNSTVGYILFGANWALSIISMILNVINVKKFRAVTMTTYILTGWMCIFVSHLIIAALGWVIFAIILAGGLFYTFGLIFYAIKKHAIWHYFVLLGSISHIVAAIMILVN